VNKKDKKGGVISSLLITPVNEDAQQISQQLLCLGSNHPRRRNEYLAGNLVPPSVEVLKWLKDSSGNVAFLYVVTWLRYIKNQVLRKTWSHITLPFRSSTLFLAYGDSHAEFLSRVISVDSSSHVASYWAGPILANSYSFRESVMGDINSVFAEVIKNRTFRRLVLIISVGEIDIRSHSWVQVNLHKNYADVDTYAKSLAFGVMSRTKSLMDSLSAEFAVDVSIVIMEPTTPGSRVYFEPATIEEYRECLQQQEYPVIGNTEYRVDVKNAYMLHLKSLVSKSDKKIKIIELYKECFSANGSLSVSASSDGCHITNTEYIARNFGKIIHAVNAAGCKN